MCCNHDGRRRELWRRQLHFRRCVVVFAAVVVVGQGVVCNTAEKTDELVEDDVKRRTRQQLLVADAVYAWPGWHLDRAHRR